MLKRKLIHYLLNPANTHYQKVLFIFSFHMISNIEALMYVL